MKQIASKIAKAGAMACLAMLTCAGCSGGQVSGSEGSSSAVVSTDSSSSGASTSDEVSFEETVVVDNDYLTITLTSFEMGTDEIEVGVTIVNKDGETDFMVATEDGCSVDGVQTNPYFTSVVSAGKTAYETISIETTDLNEAGVAMTDIYLSFHAYDSDDVTADYVVENTGTHIYPYGESEATVFVRESSEDDIVLVDNDYVTVTAIGYDPDYYWGYAVDLYIENKTDSEIVLSVEDVSINDVMCEPFWAVDLGAGLSYFGQLYWFSSTLEDAGITDYDDISEIELSFYAYDGETYEGCFDSLVVTLEP